MNKWTNHRVQPYNGNCFNFTQYLVSNDLSPESLTLIFKMNIVLPFCLSHHSAPPTILLLIPFYSYYHSAGPTILLLLPLCLSYNSASDSILVLLLLLPTIILLLLLLQRFDMSAIFCFFTKWQSFKNYEKCLLFKVLFVLEMFKFL